MTIFKNKRMSRKLKIKKKWKNYPEIGFFEIGIT